MTDTGIRWVKARIGCRPAVLFTAAVAVAERDCLTKLWPCRRRGLPSPSGCSSPLTRSPMRSRRGCRSRTSGNRIQPRGDDAAGLTLDRSGRAEPTPAPFAHSPVTGNGHRVKLDHYPDEVADDSRGRSLIERSTGSPSADPRHCGGIPAVEDGRHSVKLPAGSSAGLRAAVTFGSLTGPAGAQEPSCDLQLAGNGHIVCYECGRRVRAGNPGPGCGTTQDQVRAGRPVRPRSQALRSQRGPKP